MVKGTRQRRRGRKNRRATYRVNTSISQPLIHFRTISDVKRRLRLIKQEVKIGKTLPGSLMREVLIIFRHFGIQAPSPVRGIRVISHETWPGRVFVAQMENGEEFMGFSASGIRAKPHN